MSPYNLPSDAVWLITGCSSGIGQSLATYLATKTTSRIVATARSISTLSRIPSSPNVLKLSLDVTSDASIESALSSTISKWGRLDVLVNNAGFNILAEAETVPPEKAHAIMNTNFFGAVRLTQLSLPIMRDTNPSTGQRGGLILQITSLGGRLGFAGNSFYHASKFALEGWTEAVSKEMMDEWNIHFSCVEPGGVKTNYAHRSVQDEVSKAQHPAYADENSPTNLLRRYHEDPRSMEGWAEAERVSEVLFGVVRDGVTVDGVKEVPFRIPVGADSWGLQRKGLVVGLERLERMRDVAVGVSKDAEGQLRSIEFLEV